MSEIKEWTKRQLYAKKYYQKYRERILERTKKRYYEKHDDILKYEKSRQKKHSLDNKIRQIKRKKLVFDKYGGKCACCGEKNYDFLSIDHINNDGKAHRKIIGNQIYLWLIRNNFPKDNFQILCFNCNMAKNFYGKCPHKNGVNNSDRQWTSPYNPFNSFKALVHSKHFEAILEGKPLTPIVINFDLTNNCNYNCRFCMFGGSRDRADKSTQFFRSNKASLPNGYALTLPKLWKEWGVKACCLAGGGEPTLHPDCLPFIKECKKQNIELGFVTNGYLVNSRDWWETIALNCKFIGFSIDAGNAKDYAKTKGVPEDRFEQVIKNLHNIARVKEELNADVQIGFKFLLDEENYKSIYEAAEVASKIGVNHFQFRPAINYNNDFFKDKNVWEQIAKAQKDFERKDYKIVGVRHKFNPDFSKAHNFVKCRATMLTSTWCADGKVYLCTDTRGCPWAYLTDHYPNPENVIRFWGSKEHFKIVDEINFKKNCDRCTLAPYNEFFEQVFLKDKMDRNLI